MCAQHVPHDDDDGNARDHARRVRAHVDDRTHDRGHVHARRHGNDDDVHARPHPPPIPFVSVHSARVSISGVVVHCHVNGANVDDDGPRHAQSTNE